MGENQFFNEQTTERFIKTIEDHFLHRPKIAQLFRNCFLNTLCETMELKPDGSVFMITGDIPAMWLRDSAAQMKPYISLAKSDPKIAGMVSGVIQQQVQYILFDPYANAFNGTSNGLGHQDDNTDMSPWIWERKYEVDSLCYPIELSFLYWKETGDESIFDDKYFKMMKTVIETWKTEQNHEEQSTYRFERMDCPPSDTLTREGKGAPTGVTGMTWSGFRPSDDACEYGYLIPSNMFACVVLDYMREISIDIYKDKTLSIQAEKLKKEIQEGIEKFGIYDHPEFGKIYAYETDGLGNYNLMDDANVPSLLSIPYIGYCSNEDEIYQNTRSFILSKENPYFYQGEIAKGVGSPHTPKDYVWHIALAIQGITANSMYEMEEILNTFEQTDGGTGFMHEGFDVDDPTKYTRELFSWANAMYCQFIMKYYETIIKGDAN